MLVFFKQKIILFSISGILGFIVDAAIVQITIEPLGLYNSRLLSFICAALTTWIFNKNITFKNKKSSLSIMSEIFSYLSLMCIGGVVNYLLYIFLMTRFDLMAKNPFLAIACGSIAGMYVNFTTSKTLLFNKNK